MERGHQRGAYGRDVRCKDCTLDPNIMEQQDGQLVLKTEDLGSAKKVRAEAWKIAKEYGFYTPAIKAEMMMSITEQPQCPQCGYLGRFSDNFCPTCGVEMEGGKGSEQ